MKNTKGLKTLAKMATKTAENMATNGCIWTAWYQPKMPKSLIK